MDFNGVDGMPPPTLPKDLPPDEPPEVPSGPVLKGKYVMEYEPDAKDEFDGPKMQHPSNIDENNPVITGETAETSIGALGFLLSATMPVAKATMPKEAASRLRH